MSLAAREALYTGVLALVETGFNNSVGGSTATDKVWRDFIPAGDANGDDVKPPYCLVHSMRQNFGVFSNKDAVGNDPRVVVTVTSKTAEQTGDISEKIQDQLKTENITVSGWDVLLCRLDTDLEYNDPPVGVPQLFNIDSIYRLTLYPS